MKKIKQLLVLLIILISFPINAFAQNEEEYEDIDYIWLDEEIKNSKNLQEPNLNAKCAVVFDRSSKTIILGKNEEHKVPMASTTKIMTAIILLENVKNLEEEVEVSKQAASIGGSRVGLKTGDKISYNDLLYGLMLCSGNDAATQIAISIGGSIEGFANIMNKKAKEMGLKNTSFVTPHGLDNKNHYTTALELAIMADYALNIEEFAKVVATQNYTVLINGYPKTIKNTNELLGNLEGVNGVKTGFTNGAGRCLVTSVIRNSFNIITVVLGADTKKQRTSDSIKLIEYTYKNYELINLEQIIEEEFKNWRQINEKRIKVYKGQENNLKIKLGKIEYKNYPVLKTEKQNITIDINSRFNIEAPIEQNKKIGEIKITLNTREIMKVDILNGKKIERKTIFYHFWDVLKILFGTCQKSTLLYKKCRVGV